MAQPNPMDVSRAGMMASVGGNRLGGGPGAGDEMNFHFSPQINVPGGAGMDQINQGLQASYAEWMRMMERFLHDKRRRSYGPSDEVTA
ncbi:MULTISPECIES: hypothetical protein [unclassified Pseudomonas]|uniref:hypothetical protein n=1 Tax=unclassified Pseudomonas TaxID=196821 RepID=UPI002AC93333|nr:MULTISPECIES: hypothetical protein [unclassified Pseudomonas]MEB0045575.1 hypothetical protein [Pseudomonas sp. Dout3]MEB0095458.1 hypothetical protein [Pseudomonas sp. DC1.2]WPX61042.1 hypothetical protein RHM68_10535 [Pseudomonas sp. DC1.2]